MRIVLKNYNLFSTFSASTGAVVSGMIWFICYLPYFFLQEKYASTDLGTKLGASLLSNTGMAYGFQIILMYEGTGEFLFCAFISTKSLFLNLSCLYCNIMEREGFHCYSCWFSNLEYVRKRKTFKVVSKAVMKKS